jgi:hypothetical protein
MDRISALENANKESSRHMLAFNGGGIDKFCTMSMRRKTTASSRTKQTYQEEFPSQCFLAPEPAQYQGVEREDFPQPCLQ